MSLWLLLLLFVYGASRIEWICSHCVHMCWTGTQPAYHWIFLRWSTVHCHFLGWVGVVNKHKCLAYSVLRAPVLHSVFHFDVANYSSIIAHVGWHIYLIQLCNYIYCHVTMTTTSLALFVGLFSLKMSLMILFQTMFESEPRYNIYSNMVQQEHI